MSQEAPSGVSHELLPGAVKLVEAATRRFALP